MDFSTAIGTCFTKYADFNGRASRPEYWWYALFLFLVSIAISLLGHGASALFSLGTLLPSLAVTARRLHDTSRSGWWQLLWFVPVIGWIVMIILLVGEGTPGDNPYGGKPTA
jgi:uncharacterized membrane protein YhaH (DUF805 family)